MWSTCDYHMIIIYREGEEEGEGEGVHPKR